MSLTQNEATVTIYIPSKVDFLNRSASFEIIEWSYSVFEAV